MKTTLFLASVLLGSLSTAAPLKKRDYIWRTMTEEVYTTIEITSTVWVDAATPAAVVPQSTALTTPGAFYEQPKPSSATPAYTPSNSPAYTPSSSSVQPVVSTPVYTPPVSSSTPVYTPPPSTTQTPTPVTTPAYTPSSSTPSATPTAGSPSGTKYYGDITYYNPAGGLGSCGWAIADSDPVVALAWEMMGAQSNGNPWCGKKIAIVHNGKTFSATIGDKCGGCSGASIDLTQGLFDTAAPDVDGRGHNVEWYVVE